MQKRTTDKIKLYFNLHDKRKTLEQTIILNRITTDDNVKAFGQNKLMFIATDLGEVWLIQNFFSAMS